jgi:hypothetical protein
MKLIEILRILLLTAICCGVGSFIVLDILDAADSVAWLK